MKSKEKWLLLVGLLLQMESSLSMDISMMENRLNEKLRQEEKVRDRWFGLIREGNLEQVQNFVKNYNFDVNCRDDKYVTALELAIKNRSEKLIKWLLTKGADPNAKISEGISALKFVMNNKMIQIFRLLVKNGGNINEVDCNGNTVLMVALMGGCTDIYSEILRKGENNYEWVRFLLLGYKNKNTLTDEQILRVVDLGFRGSNFAKYINKNNNEGNSALFIAACKNDIETTKVLLRNYADINVCNHKKLSPILATSFAGMTEMVELLISYSEIDINVLDDSGVSALMYAIYKGHEKIVELLVNHPKVDVNVADMRGVTPLMTAVMRGNKNIIKMLINHADIDLSKKTNNSEELSTIILRSRRVDIIEWMMKDSRINFLSSDIADEWLRSILDGDKNRINLYLDKFNIDINVSYKGVIGLAMAAYTKEDNKDIVQMLLNRPDIDVNKKTLVNVGGDKTSVFALYIGREKPELAKLIMNHPGFEFDSSETDLIAKYILKYSYTDIIEELVNKGYMDLRVTSL